MAVDMDHNLVGSRNSCWVEYDNSPSVYLNMNSTKYSAKIAHDSTTIIQQAFTRPQ
jgi:hypothetical protein